MRLMSQSLQRVEFARQGYLFFSRGNGNESCNLIGAGKISFLSLPTGNGNRGKI